MSENLQNDAPRENKAPVPEAIVAWVKRAKATSRLTADEEKDLARRGAGGDEEAYEKMVEANLRLVITMALKLIKQFPDGHTLTLADLIEAGHTGVKRAARKFDAETGLRFSTYASFWIRGAIMRAIADASRDDPTTAPID